MRHPYKKIVLSTMTAMLLAACGSNVKEDGAAVEEIVVNMPSTETKLAKAQLGVLSGATVKIEELGTVPYELLYTETTSSGESIEEIGNFNAHSESYKKDKFYLLSVSGGLDMDANDDGEIDAIPTINKGTFHAIVKGEDAKAVEGAFKVTTASELVYKKVESDIEDTSTLEEKLDESAKEVLQKSTDETVEVNNADILGYDPIKHKEHFQEAYQERLPELIKDIHDDKKVDLKLAPTADAGIDKSIMIGEDLELRGKGLDLDGKINTYSWSENSEVLSQQRNLTYAPTAIGLHTLTLTVTDNDGLSGSDRVNITVSEKPNSTPMAKSKTIYVSEDTKRSFVLEGSDADGDMLTYKVLENPVYGQLSGKAPNFIYTPDADFNGDDRVIYVANDGKADSQKALIKIHVEPSNDKPEILFDGDSITTKEDTPKRFTLKAEDQEKDTLTYTITQKPKEGTLTHKKDSFIYTPKADFYGKDSFIVSVEDGNGGEDSKEINVNVTPVNDAPTVDIGDSKSMLAGESITLSANAKDIDGKVVKYEWKEDTKLLSTSASFAYKQEEVGSHTITLTITDDQDATATDRVVVHVDEIPNEKPEAKNLSIQMKEDTTTNITLIASDKDEDKLTYKILQNPLHGTLSGKAPSLSYAPVKDYFGKDYFTFRANDGKDDSNIAKVSITIDDVIEADTTAPVIDLHGSANMVITQGTKVVIPNATAKDDRDGVVKVITSGKVDITKVGQYTLTYTAIDKAGNKATKTRTVKVIAAEKIDDEAPVITLKGSVVETVVQNSLYYQVPGVTVKDNVDGYISYQKTGTVDLEKIGTYTITYTAEDKAGNKSSKKRTVKVIAPTYNVTPILNGDKLTIKWSGFPDRRAHSLYISIQKFGEPGSRRDYSGGSGEKTFILERESDNSIRYTIKVYDYQHKLVFTKKYGDDSAPVITLKGEAIVSIVQGKNYTDAGATAKDDKDGIVAVKVTGSVNTAKVGTYKITYTATDKAGNKATKTRTVKVIPPADKTAPVITLKGASTVTIVQGTKYVEPGATAKDDVDTSVSVKRSGSVDTSKVGTYKITYTATDKAGNKATKTRTIKVVAPTYKVTSTLDGDKLTVKWRGFPDTGLDGVKIMINRSTRTRWYSGKGESGEMVISLDRADYETYHYTLTVSNYKNKAVFTKKFDMAPAKIDKKAPVITVKGDSTITIFQGVKYYDAGATAKDDVDTSVSVKRSGSVDTSKAGTYKITYTATDKAGNKATKTRTVKVVVPQHNVKVSVSGDKLTLTWSSFIDKQNTGRIKINSTTKMFSGTSGKQTFTIDPTRVNYILIYDEKLNEIYKKTFQPTVDKYPPRITVNKGDRGYISVNIPMETPYKEYGATAKDDFDGSVKVKVSGKVDIHKPGSYKITYTATDKAGNKATATRTVRVYDNVKPILQLNGDRFVYVNIGEKYIDEGATVLDNVDRDIKVDVQISTQIPNENGVGSKGVTVPSVDTSKEITYTIYYHATDKAGNRAKYAYRYVIVKKQKADTRAPRITLNGNFKWKDSGGTLRSYYPRQQLNGAYREEGATAIDDKDGKVSVKISYGKLTKSLFRAGKPSSTQGIYVVFYTAKDKAGNKAVKYRLVLQGLAAWYPSMDYEVAVYDYIKEHFKEF